MQTTIDYPSPSSTSFLSTLLKRKEFISYYQRQIKDLHTSEDLLEQIHVFSQQYCSEQKYLFPHQSILRNFMSPWTPYKNLLLFHGTGSGKTLTSLYIAEQFKSFSSSSSSSSSSPLIYIVAPTHILQQFTAILIPERILEESMHGKVPDWDTFVRHSFLRDAYYQEYITLLKQFPNHPRQCFQTILKKYYYMHRGMIGMTYFQLKNKIQSLLRSSSSPFHAIRKEFHNSLFLIDEVHHLSSSLSTSEDRQEESQHEEEKKGGDTTTLLSAMLHMFQYVHESLHPNSSSLYQQIHIRLLFMSATPMRNQVSEILPLLQLMVYNEPPSSKRNRMLQHLKKELSSTNQEERIDVIQELSPKAIDLLRDLFQGRVSYLRTEHPFYFPLRLPPLSTNYHSPTVPYSSPSTHPHDLSLTFLPIYPSYFSTSLSKRILASLSSSTSSTISSSFSIPDIQHMIFWNEIDDRNHTPVVVYHKKEYHYHPSIRSSFLSSYPPLHVSNLEKFSPKLHSVLQLIQRAKGIVMIFSHYIVKGLLLMASILEENGYRPHPLHGVSSFFPEAVARSRSDDTPSYYCLLTASIDPETLYSLVNMINDSSNVSGKQCKVILGSPKIQEGLDFKNIREIHLLNAWWNISTLQQITGRGLRNCSHHELPFKKRNCTIYYHVSMYHPSISKKETIDHYMYRISEMKQIQISKVERVMQQVSFDCYLHTHYNYLPPSLFQHLPSVKIVDSQSNSRKIPLYDVDYSKACFFQTCHYECYPFLEIEHFVESHSQLSNLSFLHHFQSFLDRLQDSIRNYFRDPSSSPLISYDELREIIHRNITNPEIQSFFNLALWDLIHQGTILYDHQHNPKGRLIQWKGNLVIRPLSSSATATTTIDSKQDIFFPKYTKKHTTSISVPLSSMPIAVDVDQLIQEWKTQYREVVAKTHDFLQDLMSSHPPVQNQVIHEYVLDHYTPFSTIDNFLQFAIESWVSSSSFSPSDSSPVHRNHFDQYLRIHLQVPVSFVNALQLYLKSPFQYYTYLRIASSSPSFLVLKQLHVPTMKWTWKKQTTPIRPIIQYSTFEVMGTFDGQYFKINRETQFKRCTTFTEKELTEQLNQLHISHHREMKDKSFKCLLMELYLRYVSYVQPEQYFFERVSMRG